ncbi:MAG: 3-hydroxyacyl-CoA dehydrogenase NAD-binding domain-containing protein [Planctomycetota bacterium]|nr:3-hydroxyacyl-CoA dehydrogenase NAD-binding domain-containing protein [Planctomycetota bacterium]
MTSRDTLGLLGTGAMGAGIAQVAASHGWHVKLLDTTPAIVDKAIGGIEKRLQRSVEKGRMTADDAQGALNRLHAVHDPAELDDCTVLLEAIVEDLDAKVDAMTPLLDKVPTDAIIATNTSSLSVTDLGERLGTANRTCGMHFFNPAPVMRLVEVIRGKATDQEVIDRAVAIATDWGKQVACAADTPGFIVNRVARPYYLEAFRCLEDGLAGPDLIDSTMKELGGFRMGPLELTDFIGHDVNTATTRTVWNCWNQPSRLMPSLVQEQLVAEGHLGRKTGAGVYDWSGETPLPLVRPGHDAATVDGSLMEPIRKFTMNACSGTDEPVRQVIFTRILCGLLNEAMWAKQDGVGDTRDIDVAMRYGVNYPRGPFEWLSDIGEPVAQEAMSALEHMTGTGRFIPPVDPADQIHSPG